jgi:hypothetical protein
MGVLLGGSLGLSGKPDDAITPWRFPGVLAAALLFPGINALVLLLPNTIALLFPAWAGTQQGRGGGIEVMGQRLVFSLVNEAAHILEEGIAAKAGDIDIAYVFGYGFPAYRGGPMNYANEVGLFNVVQAMQRFALNPLDDAAFWQPAPLLARLVADGKTFN